MAPVLATCRLSPLFLSLVAQNVNPLLVYDRQALMDIQLSAKDLQLHFLGGNATAAGVNAADGW